MWEGEICAGPAKKRADARPGCFACYPGWQLSSVTQVTSNSLPIATPGLGEMKSTPYACHDAGSKRASVPLFPNTETVEYSVENLFRRGFAGNFGKNGARGFQTHPKDIVGQAM